MNKRIMLPIVILCVVTSVMVSGCINSPTPSQINIGGDRDEQGCLTAAGYSWDKDVGACTRNWELDESQKKAAGTAVDHVGSQKGLTVMEVQAFRCIGCFVINLDRYGDRIEVELVNWTVKSETLNIHYCTEKEKAAEACTMEYDPVCGYIKDGKSQTYSNGCVACSAGAEYWTKGECETAKEPEKEYEKDTGENQQNCEDLCGDGICQEVVCQAIGCPCAETPESCPEDCA